MHEIGNVTKLTFYFRFCSSSDSKDFDARSKGDRSICSFEGELNFSAVVVFPRTQTMLLFRIPRAWQLKWSHLMCKLSAYQFRAIFIFLASQFFKRFFHIVKKAQKYHVKQIIHCSNKTFRDFQCHCSEWWTVMSVCECRIGPQPINLRWRKE